MRADPGAFGNANPGGMKPAVCNSFLSSAKVGFLPLLDSLRKLPLPMGCVH